MSIYIGLLVVLDKVDQFAEVLNTGKWEKPLFYIVLKRLSSVPNADERNHSIPLSSAHTHTYLTWSCDLLWISHERLRYETEITGLTVPLNQFSPFAMAKLALDQGKWKHASSLLLILMAPLNGSQRDLTLVPTPQWRRVPKPPHTAIYIIFLQHV